MEKRPEGKLYENLKSLEPKVQNALGASQRREQSKDSLSFSRRITEKIIAESVGSVLQKQSPPEST